MNQQNEIKVSMGSIFAVLSVIVALVGTTGYFYGKSTNVLGQTIQAPTNAPAQPTRTAITIDKIRTLFNDKNITFGDKNSNLLYVEFSDPSCPFCHVAAGKNPELNKKMGAQFVTVNDGGKYVPPVPEIRKLVDAGKAAFVWLYANGHGNGEMATIAQYCANEKGKFWDVHDLLMSAKGYDLLNNTVQNDRSKSSVLADFLKSAVDPAEMKSCIDSGRYNERLSSDMALAQEFGFQGTPDFFVNTNNYAWAYSFSEMN